MSVTPSDPSPAVAPWLVACLCAQWCRTCDAYRDTLLAVRAAVAAARPGHAPRFQWIDIEDEADLLGDLDIEDFPTLLLAHGDDIVFFGPLTPQPATLERLVRSALDGALAAPASLPPAARALPARLRAHADL